MRCDSIDGLSEPAFLARLLGPVVAVERRGMGTPGFSGSSHTRLELALAGGRRASLVLKRTRLEDDWTAYRTGDALGREAMLLASPELSAVWDAFACPYLAWASEPGAIGLLMRDLGPHLLPDVREPLTLESEDALLLRLARMHARFWEAPELALPWLARARHPVSVLGPEVLAADPLPPLPSPMRERVAEGWTEALRHLPARSGAFLRRPVAELEPFYDSLPQTLVHGDVKVANFAFQRDGEVAAFDWALVARAPAGVDLGWYLAVNASRLARRKEEVLSRYRALLEAALERRLEEVAWAAMTAAVVITGARMLLWSKALAVRDGRPGAEAEWEWWARRLKYAVPS